MLLIWTFSNINITGIDGGGIIPAVWRRAEATQTQYAPAI